MPFDSVPRPVVAYHVEGWSSVLREMVPLWSDHYREVALDKDVVPLSPDFLRYYGLESEGKLHVVTVRKDGPLVGYLVAIVQTHLHYSTTLFATFDLFYLKPEERIGWRGVSLFRAAERSLRQRGVTIVQGNTKVHVSPVTGKSLDVGPIMKFLGWTEVERTYRKRVLPWVL